MSIKLSEMNSGSKYKVGIAKSFDRASSTYDAFSDFQLKVLSRLFSSLPCLSSRVSLDLGCGTGNASAFLKDLSKVVVSLDLSTRMLKKASEKCKGTALVCADAEALPFRASVFDVVLSNLTVQWSQNLIKLSEEVNCALRHEGYFLVSSLCHGSMNEISRCWLAVDGREHINQYLDHASTLAQLSSSGFIASVNSIESITMWFDTPEEAIDSIKKIGASLLVNSENRRSVVPSVWRQFLNEYEQLRTEKGIPLTYKVAYFLLQKQ